MTANDPQHPPRAENGLSALLKKTYQPVEPRAGFRESLLERLKIAQREQARLTRMRRVRRWVGGLSAVAAAVVVATVMVVQNPEPSTAVKVPGAGMAAIAMATPAEAVVPVAVPLQVRGAVAVRAENGVKVAQTEPGQSGAMEVAPGAWMVMQGNSRLAVVADGAVRVDQGLMLLSVRPDAQAVRVQLADHAMDVKPGTRLAMEYKPAANFAEGGRPAPVVALVNGDAVMTHGGAVQALASGASYQVFPAVAQAIRMERPVEASVLREIDQTLVNYTGH